MSLFHRLSRRIKIQLVVFALVSVVASTVMTIKYVELPNILFGVGTYEVTVELPATGGLYAGGNVTYRGTEVGRVEKVRLTHTGVEAVLAIKSSYSIPSDITVEVHSVSAVGEQYVALLPHSAQSAPLRNGDKIAADRTSIPPDINAVIDATNRGLQAIPAGDLKTAVGESYTAVGGLGPELSRLVRGSTALALDAKQNLDPWMSLIDQAGPVLNSQTDSANAIQSWAANLANITSQLQTHDRSVAGIVSGGADAAQEGRQLIERLRPTLPVLLANLVSPAQVAVTYQPAIEQLLVLLPQGIAALQAGVMAGLDQDVAYHGIYLDFNLNFNLPSPCTTGFLPTQQRRNPALVDTPKRPEGDLYCRIPQDSMFDVRGARNYPCLTRPGKRAPTVKMCESDEQYVPLNDGVNWKGDPNATTSGQAVPQGAPPEPAAAPPPAPPAAIAQYDPATGAYVGPDGRMYTQRDLANGSAPPTWQSMVIPPPSHP